MTARRNWSEGEVRHALALYLVTPFGRLHARNPDVVSLAEHLGRSANAVALKLTNLASLDETLPQQGMANASVTDRRVWREFLSDPQDVLSAFRAQADRPAKLEPEPSPAGLAEEGVLFQTREGAERRAERSLRVGQDFFRRMILASYRGRCALTGIEDGRLLNAGHIVPWREEVRHRLNPANGICLNALHDRAFDRHLITFDEDHRMVISPHVPVVARRKLEAVECHRLMLPDRFLPHAEFLERHRRRFFDVIRSES